MASSRVLQQLGGMRAPGRAPSHRKVAGGGLAAPNEGKGQAKGLPGSCLPREEEEELSLTAYSRIIPLSLLIPPR